MSAGEKLRNLRKAKWMTQFDLAKRSGISQQVISHYESGRNAIGAGNIVKLARALDCQPEDVDERFASLAARAASAERMNCARRINDDMLRYVVDAWAAMTMEAKSQILNIAVEQQNTASGKPVYGV